MIDRETNQMNLLICNIGSSDLDRDALAELRGLSERERAARILADYAAYQPRLALPIIGKALRHVQRQPGELACVVLVASDQGADPPADALVREDWGKDTSLTAQIVARCLAGPVAGARPVPADRIAIWLIADEQGGARDPSDYDGVRRFFERRLPALRADYPAATVYLEVTGGTPAMTTGLLVAGAEVFGARAEALYIHPRQPLPATLNTAKRLQAGPLRAALRSNIATYDYDAALRGFQAQRALIADRLDQGAPELLAALLEYARCRFNFDFGGARQALERGIDQAGDGRWRPAVMELYQAVYQPDRSARLAEVYHGAAARYAVGAYADFLTQVVRFQENALRTLCLDRGAIFIDRDGNRNPAGHRLQTAWADAQGFQSRFDRPGDTRDRSTNRALLRDLARHLGDQRGELLAPLLDELNRLNELANLRNELVHTFEGVSKLDLARAFAGRTAAEARADDILPHMAASYARIAGRPVHPPLFAGINELLLRLAPCDEL